MIALPMTDLEIGMDDKNISISAFDDITDNASSTYTLKNWNEVVLLLQKKPLIAYSKAEVPAYNFARYSIKKDSPEFWVEKTRLRDGKGERFPRRIKENIEFIGALVLDYDGGLSIQEAMDRFKEYCHVGYTTHSHLKDGKTEKFRVVIKLEKPISVRASDNQTDILWDCLTPALSLFAGPVDESSFNPNQIYLVPSVSPERAHCHRTWSNTGRPLSISELPAGQLVTSNARKALEPTISKPFGHVSRIPVSEKRFSPNQIFTTSHGSVTAREVTQQTSVACIFHDDANPSAFLARTRHNELFLYCSACREKFYMDMSEMGTSPKSVLEVSGEQELRHAADEFIEETFKSIQSDKAKQSHVLYMPEGAGKSRLALKLAATGGVVIFCCKSWSQAQEKHLEFKAVAEEQNFEARFVRSRGGNAKLLFKSDPVRKKRENPFEVGALDEAKSIAKFIECNPTMGEEFIRFAWSILGDERIWIDENQDANSQCESLHQGEEFIAGAVGDLDSGEIVVTTFAYMKAMFAKGDLIPDNATVWIDDPDITDVMNISRAGPAAKSDAIQAIQGRRYFTCTDEKMLGLGQAGFQCVYTTTEMLTKDCIEHLLTSRGRAVVVHDGMTRACAGQVSVLGTEKVRSKWDGIIPLVSRVVSDEGHSHTLIANGLGVQHNHSNTKGKNTLSKNSLLVELSIPHQQLIETCHDCFGKDIGLSKDEVTKRLLLDSLHQALGRNSGFRFNGYEAVVLVDKKYHKYIAENCRYDLDSNGTAQVDWIAGLGRNDFRTKDGATEFARSVENHLRDFDWRFPKLPTLTRQAKLVIEEIRNDQRKVVYVKRLLTSLIQHFAKQLSFDEKEERWVFPSKTCQFVSFGNWLIDNYLSKTDVANMLSDIGSGAVLP